jgi:hypothetical protein
MTHIEEIAEALQALPEDRREEIAELVLEVIANAAGESLLTDEQLAEAERRRATFVPGDPRRIDALLVRLRAM